MTLAANMKAVDDLIELEEFGHRTVVDDPVSIDAILKFYDCGESGDYCQLIVLEDRNHNPMEIWGVQTEAPEIAACLWPPERLWRAQ